MQNVGLSRRHMQRLLRQLLLLYADEHQLDTEQIRNVTLRSFFHWLNDRDECDAFADICDGIAIERTCGTVLRLGLQDPFAFFDLVGPYWDYVRIIEQPIAVVPSIVNVAMTLGYGELPVADDAAMHQAGTEFHEQMGGAAGRFQIVRGPAVTLLIEGKQIDNLTALGCLTSVIDRLRSLLTAQGMQPLQPRG